MTRKKDITVLTKFKSKLRRIKLAAAGAILLLTEVLVLAISFCADIESNLPLLAAIALMVAGTLLIVIQAKKSSKY